MSSRLDFPKVELHVHLDGAIRLQTIIELAHEKCIDLHGAQTTDELRRLVVTETPATLAKVLAAFNIFLPTVVGDSNAIERIAYELCEDRAVDGVVYFEARYSPIILSNVHVAHHPDFAHECQDTIVKMISPDEVVRAVKRGFDRGFADFGIIARSILCCLRGFESYNEQILNLGVSHGCNKHQLLSFSVSTMADQGVVAIDAAGCAHGADEQYSPDLVAVFQRAAELGLHRTVHAGESGQAKEVIKAVENMKAERIGHGYRMMHDEKAYREYAINRRIHIEACPKSSVITGSVPLDWEQHPIKRWATDNVNFSLSTDDPTCFGNDIRSELALVHDSIGLSNHQIWRCQLNAAESCFLPTNEKNELIQLIAAARPAPKYENSDDGIIRLPN